MLHAINVFLDDVIIIIIIIIFIIIVIRISLSCNQIYNIRIKNIFRKWQFYTKTLVSIYRMMVINIKFF